MGSPTGTGGAGGCVFVGGWVCFASVPFDALKGVFVVPGFWGTEVVFDFVFSVSLVLSVIGGFPPCALATIGEFPTCAIEESIGEFPASGFTACALAVKT